MSGTKAQYLADLCRAQGHAMLRFDYSGHGVSGGQFENGSISAWTQDTLAVIKAAVDGSLILIGSSMGGWIMLHVALALGSQVSGMIGIAAAPDFTRDLMWRDLTAEQRDTLNRDGVVLIDSEYDPDGYPVTKAFIEDGERNLLLENP
jgi:pimeloyl-ACP methyl ester carboxylesterase